MMPSMARSKRAEATEATEEGDDDEGIEDATEDTTDDTTEEADDEVSNEDEAGSGASSRHSRCNRSSVACSAAKMRVQRVQPSMCAATSRVSLFSSSPS